MRPLLLFGFSLVSLYFGCITLVASLWLIAGLALPSKGLRLVRAKRQ